MGNNTSKEKAKVVVVFGATDPEGVAVLTAMKDDPHFKLKAIVNNAESEEAKTLAKEGVTVVGVSADNVESIEKAIHGAYGVFAITDYGEHADAEVELQEGKNIADACLKENVEVFIYDTHEKEHTEGKGCSHFDVKAKILAYMKEIGVSHCGIIHANQMEDLFGKMKPTKNVDGDYILDLKTEGTKLDMVTTDEIGVCIHNIFKDSEPYLNKTLGLSTAKNSIKEYADTLTNSIRNTFKATEEKIDHLERDGKMELASLHEFYVKGKLINDIDFMQKLQEKIDSFEGSLKLT